jgi:hypothetical protein
VAQTDIKAALAKLDSMNDNHWTEDSLPRLEAVRRFLARNGVAGCAGGRNASRCRYPGTSGDTRAQRPSVGAAQG